MVKKEWQISQLMHESETWKHSLGFVMEECIFLKNRLADITRNIEAGENGLLERIEFFQNRLVQEDEMVNRLKAEVVDQDKMLVRDLYEENESLAEVRGKQKRLRKAVENLEQDFNHLKSDFNNYLGEMV